MGKRSILSYRLAGFALATALTVAVMPVAAAALPDATASAATTRWSDAAARDLLAVAAGAGDEGLDPAAYDTAAIRDALAAHDGTALDTAAGRVGLALARDFSQGRVADREAFDWHIERSPYEAYALAEGLNRAVADGTLRAWYAGLLPQNDEYRALRTALADTGDAAMRDRIRANMERWRWMPRALGSDYLYVNVPSYRLQVVEDGTAVSSYDVVVGAADTPTPLLALTASSVVVNPWWNVPDSIAKKGLGRGYQAVRNADGSVRWRQAPGPQNALGRIKIDMPNEHAIYLHDTPSKAGFAKANRALSHGCIRVKDIDRLAAELMARSPDPARLEVALTTRDTTTLTLEDRWPVYLVYFTVEARDGKVRTLADPYRRDAALLASLDRPAGVQTASAATSRDAAPVVIAAR